MNYVDGFVTPVQTANRKTYIAFAQKAWPILRDLGAIHAMECWGDDVPKGKVTDFHRAVSLKDGETVVFSWITWPDKATRDKAMEKMMDDTTMAALGAMPFDGKRMIYGGFVPVWNSEAAQ